jgi:hypothetical protein
MRLKNGTASPFSGGTFIPASGPPRPVAWSDVHLEPLVSWRSLVTRAIYPAVWSLSVASIGLEVKITPLLSDQELSTTQSTGVTYWEGACRVEGTRSGRPAPGRAYVEMTGYAGRDVPGVFVGPLTLALSPVGGEGMGATAWEAARPRPSGEARSTSSRS